MALRPAPAPAATLSSRSGPAATLPPPGGVCVNLGVWAFVALVLLLAVSTAARSLTTDSARVARMVATFEAGCAPSASWGSAPLCDEGWFRFADARARVPRAALVADIADIFSPHKTNLYSIIIGNTGSGKSTVIRRAVRALPSPKGAVYFSADPHVAAFSSDLARVVGYTHPLEGRAGGASWYDLSRALVTAAMRFHTLHGRPAVLILDSIDYIAKRDAAFFGNLQDWAKVCADTGHLRVVFVMSEGITLPLMRSKSAWTRAMRPYEVMDLDDAAAVEYLAGHGVARPVAEEAVRTITGGRFVLLHHVAHARSAASVAALQRTLDVSTSAGLKELGLQPTHAFFRALVDAGYVEKHVALDHVNRTSLTELLRTNVVVAHADGAYRAHSRHVESFLRRAGADAQGRE